MSENTAEKHRLSENDALVPAMIYYDKGIVWGNLVTKKAIRASTWLRMSNVPNYFVFYDAHLLLLSGGQPVHLSYDEINMPVNQIIAMHVMPPAKPEMDYDPNEPFRKIEKVSALSGLYRFDGGRRMSTMSDLHTSLMTSAERWASLYDVTVSYPTLPAMKPIKTPLVLLRQEYVIYITSTQVG